MVMSQGPCSNPFGFQIGLRTMWSSFKSHLNGQNSHDFLFVCCVLFQLLCWLLSPPSTPFLFHEPAWILRIQPFMAAVLPTWHKGCVGFLGVYTFASVSVCRFLSVYSFFLSICTVAVSLASFEIMFAPPPLWGSQSHSQDPLLISIYLTFILLQNDAFILLTLLTISMRNTGYFGWCYV